MNLLEKAKSNPTPNKKGSKPTNEEFDLAIAWAKGEISLPQVCFAIGKKQTGQGQIFLLRTLRAYVLKNQ